MSKEKFLGEVEEFWPKNAPDIQKVFKYVEKYKNDKIVIKCGGNVLIDPELFKNFISDIVILKKLQLSWTKCSTYDLTYMYLIFFKP